MITVSLCYLLCLLYLLWTSYIENQKKYYIIAKTITSIGFIAIALISYCCSQSTAYYFALLPGLILCLLGDVFLAIRVQTKKFKWFIWGLLMFAFAHIMFIFLIQKYTLWYWWDFLLPLASLVLVFFLFQLPSMEPGKGKWPCLIYSYFVTLFLIKALESMISWEYSTRGKFLAIGSFLFFVSDFILIFLYFSKNEKKWLHGGNLIMYYLGVGLIASSIYFG